jgi:hypothetical protein
MLGGHPSRLHQPTLKGSFMGTRHLVAVQIDGVYKVAQYGQWDGYPSGQGVRVLDFLRNGDIEALKRNLGKVFEPTEEDSIRMWAEFGIDIVASNGMVEYGKANAFGEKYPSLDRDTGAGILELIAGSDGEDKIPLRVDIGFAGDSLFCEWAYVIDFDIGTFEAYKGFNTEGPVPAGSRFSEVEWDDSRSGRGVDTYYQVTLAQSWKLADQPSEEAFLEAFKSPDEDAEAEDDTAATPQEPTASAAESAPAPDAEASDRDRPVWSE